jgi:hypothetical protein
MSKQQLQSQGTHSDTTGNENSKQTQDREAPTNNPASGENAGRGKEAGGEESKHGRKQKGNVDDT